MVWTAYRRVSGDAADKQGHGMGTSIAGAGLSDPTGIF